SLSKAQSLTVERKKCYAISVSGIDIDQVTPASSCSPETGKLAGFVAGGEILSIDVPRGENRKFELYMLLQKEGDNSACPVMEPVISKSMLSQIYLVGKVEGITLAQAEETVNITLETVDETQNLAKQLNLPSNCLPSSAPKGHLAYQISAARGTASASGIQLKGRVGSIVGSDQQILTGSNIQLRIK
ncbi:MAG: hypothetical protein AB7H97_07540, partial [Pseudobdellovibrionaceae bacterium]